jgi:acetyl esterase
MALHPQCRLVLDQIAALAAKPLEQETPAEARAWRNQISHITSALAGPVVEMASVDDRTIPGVGGPAQLTGPAQPIPVRVYRPSAEENLPVLVYFHGGGWVFGTLDTVDRPCRALAHSAECVVVSVDYRLAPEHKFPAAADDAYAVVRYVAEHPAEFHADSTRIAVGGDSAGGNLSAAVSLMARDRGGPAIRFQLLVYPCVDYDDDRPSVHEYAEGHLLTRAALGWFWGHYVASAEDGRHMYASPINAADLSGLPPALVITAECDPIRDQGEAYAQKLEAAGVPVEVRRYEGAIHAFFQMGAVIDAGRDAVADAGTALRAAFARAVTSAA